MYFSVYDMGGQRGQRRKWLQMFDSITAIIFVLDCSCYDLSLREDNTKNRMLEACDLFHQLWNNRYIHSEINRPTYEWLYFYWLINLDRMIDPLGEIGNKAQTNHVVRHATTLFTISAKMWNRRFNWPVCMRFHCPNSKEFSWCNCLMTRAKSSFSQTHKIGNNGIRGLTMWKQKSGNKMLLQWVLKLGPQLLGSEAHWAIKARVTWGILKLSFVHASLQSWT